MEIIALTEAEKTIELSTIEDTLVQGVISFENVYPVEILWSTTPFSETNNGGIRELGQGVAFSEAKDIYFKQATFKSLVHCRSVGL